MKNDFELRKKIAEIEGYSPYIDCGKVYIEAPLGHEALDHGCKYITYNPLTDKGLLFDLMVKHEVFIDYHVSEVIMVDYEKQKSYEVDFDTTDDIPRSILECIIYAAKGE